MNQMKHVGKVNLGPPRYYFQQRCEASDPDRTCTHFWKPNPAFRCWNLQQLLHMYDNSTGTRAHVPILGYRNHFRLQSCTLSRPMGTRAHVPILGFRNFRLGLLVSTFACPILFLVIGVFLKFLKFRTRPPHDRVLLVVNYRVGSTNFRPF
jgi:hypothetical protein